MAATPTLTLIDQLVTAVNTAWAPTGNDSVSRAYFKRIADVEDDNLKLVGRKVYLFPTGYSYEGFTRGEDQYRHEITALCVERYNDAAGDPTNSWIDTRVDFVWTYLVNGLDFDNRSGAQFTANKNVVTNSAEVQVCDVEKLTGGGRLFYSLVSLVFLELVDVS
jgi:hypothetical protein